MTIIEQGEGLDGKTQGVVLALVGPDAGSPSTKDGDHARTLRMYNLLSLTSLAKWAIAQKVGSFSCSSVSTYAVSHRVHARWIYGDHRIGMSRQHLAKSIEIREASLVV